MHLLFTIFVVLFFNVVDRADSVAFDYCTKNCAEEQHTMCKYTSYIVDFAACKSDNISIVRTWELEVALLHEHNLARQKVAQGELEGQPKASNMMKLKWNYEAADIAQRWLNQCKFGQEDLCRNLKDGTSVGQSHFTLASKGTPFNDSEIAANGINKWLESGQSLDEEIIKHFKSTDLNITSYSQLVWAESTDVGCGLLIEYVENGTEFVNVICNYAPSGNVLTREIYKIGEPGTECPGDGNLSKTYPGLCISADDSDTDDHTNDTFTNTGTNKPNGQDGAPTKKLVLEQTTTVKSEIGSETDEDKEDVTPVREETTRVAGSERVLNPEIFIDVLSKDKLVTKPVAAQTPRTDESTPYKDKKHKTDATTSMTDPFPRTDEDDTWYKPDKDKTDATQVIKETPREDEDGDGDDDGDEDEDEDEDDNNVEESIPGIIRDEIGLYKNVEPHPFDDDEEYSKNEKDNAIALSSKPSPFVECCICLCMLLLWF